MSQKLSAAVSAIIQELNTAFGQFWIEYVATQMEDQYQYNGDVTNWRGEMPFVAPITFEFSLMERKDRQEEIRRLRNILDS